MPHSVVGGHIYLKFENTMFVVSEDVRKKLTAPRADIYSDPSTDGA